ncbi:hypothetical protein CVT26_013157 [Gymnopilus dilepis]|uniref:Uncharacterized protein n=1 Tax=Gymnopilus dilepis TaxID=231916 RepID=A0A409X009_9AGAR|nr:hypothetical protein CVT26_013157 [Gymnopilus dilepis]
MGNDLKSRLPRGALFPSSCIPGEAVEGEGLLIGRWRIIRELRFYVSIRRPSFEVLSLKSQLVVLFGSELGMRAPGPMSTYVVFRPTVSKHEN